jgi:integrase
MPPVEISGNGPFQANLRPGAMLGLNHEEESDMSIRKRTWKTSKGESKEAWIVDYLDQGVKRRLKTFERKKDADAWWKKAGNEIVEGVHTPDSESITVEEAARLWLESCSDLERATVVAYKQHVDFHIVPLIGGTKLSQLSAPMVHARLGHSTLAMTADTYGHLFPRGDDRAEMEAAERSLLGERDTDATCRAEML